MFYTVKYREEDLGEVFDQEKVHKTHEKVLNQVSELLKKLDAGGTEEIVITI